MENGVHKNERSERRSLIVNECMNGVHFHAVNEDVNGVQKFGERFSRSFEPRHQKALLDNAKKQLNISSHYRKRLKSSKNSTLSILKIAKKNAEMNDLKKL